MGSGKPCTRRTVPEVSLNAHGGPELSNRQPPEQQPEYPQQPGYPRPAILSPAISSPAISSPATLSPAIRHLAIRRVATSRAAATSAEKAAASPLRSPGRAGRHRPHHRHRNRCQRRRTVAHNWIESHGRPGEPCRRRHRNLGMGRQVPGHHYVGDLRQACRRPVRRAHRSRCRSVRKVAGPAAIMPAHRPR